jgi:hypothetical protein
MKPAVIVILFLLTSACSPKGPSLSASPVSSDNHDPVAVLKNALLHQPDYAGRLEVTQPDSKVVFEAVRRAGAMSLRARLDGSGILEIIKLQDGRLVQVNTSARVWCEVYSPDANAAFPPYDQLAGLVGELSAPNIEILPESMMEGIRVFRYCVRPTNGGEIELAIAPEMKWLILKVATSGGSTYALSEVSFEVPFGAAEIPTDFQEVEFSEFNGSYSTTP